MTDVQLQYITLEQWRTLITVVDTGGYAQAATVLHKSQSSVTYAVQKIESLLGLKVFEIQGRKAVLTPTGQFLYRRAKALLDESSALERAARRLSAGWEAEIRLAAEIIFPTWLLLDCMNRFGKESPHTRIELIESVLGGTSEALLSGQVDFAIAGQVPPGFLGSPLMRLRFLPIASPDHPLHQLGRKLTIQDLRAHRHIVVRESGTRQTRKTLVDATQRWTVTDAATSIEAVRSGYGFSWFSEEKIRNELRSGVLKPLPMREGGEMFVELYLILADPDSAGPGVQRLAQIIRESTASECALRYEEAEEAEEAGADEFTGNAAAPSDAAP
ncbi:LysR family transcriptional regulator [Noviherbaspirillum cavernae]|uniref:LysR family transcriptional regulator n=1 Tax=Noviherbaspirillum cavernae TaxID=2320862 RepID=A0A418X0R7_9BURK|nr:LysR family transcriptional regulator [Noviherbaspirillum cavernae]RJG06088.1 LysR family transcriptional regulator [Noviherbaspirillum cavernae]